MNEPKVSQVIAALSEAMANHGDLRVIVVFDSGHCFSSTLKVKVDTPHIEIHID